MYTYAYFFVPLCDRRCASPDQDDTKYVIKIREFAKFVVGLGEKAWAGQAARRPGRPRGKQSGKQQGKKTGQANRVERPDLPASRWTAKPKDKHGHTGD